jgi:hypothetical protein
MKCPKCKRPAHGFGDPPTYWMCIPSEGGCGHMFGRGVSHGGALVADGGEENSEENDDGN